MWKWANKKDIMIHIAHDWAIFGNRARRKRNCLHTNKKKLQREYSKFGCVSLYYLFLCYLFGVISFDVCSRRLWIDEERHLCMWHTLYACEWTKKGHICMWHLVNRWRKTHLYVTSCGSMKKTHLCMTSLYACDWTKKDTLVCDNLWIDEARHHVCDIFVCL